MHFRSRRQPTRAVHLALALVLAAGALPAHGDDAQIRELEQRIEQLEKANQTLRKDTRGLEVREEERSKLKPVAGWKDGFFIQSEDGSYKLKVGGYTHFDGHYFIDNRDSGNTSTFLFRRARIDLRGTLLKYLDFRITPDFAGGNLVLQDAYADFRYFPEASLQAGKFKVPFGLERLQSANALLFVERSLADNLVPNRDLGFALHGDFWHGALHYTVGIFNGVTDGGSGDIDLNGDKEFAGRVFAQPFLDGSTEALRGLGLGFAGTYGHQRGSPGAPNLPQYRSSGRSTIFRYVTDTPATAAGTTVAADDHYRFTPQAYYHWRSLGILGEYVSSTQGVRKDGASDEVTNTGWQLAVSDVLTGEAASYQGVVPAHPFDPFRPFTSGWGAFEVVGRYSTLDIDDDAFSRGYASPTASITRARDWGVGLNWSLNTSVRLMLDYEETYFEGGGSNGDRQTERLFLSRVQLVL